ncbi:MAG: GAF domain-containing protein [Nitrospirae bacterium]|nr:MAG: GAF domain-containing protein [Nitrospirota bacterium]
MKLNNYHSDNENLNKLLDGITAEIDDYAKTHGLEASPAGNPLTDTLNSIIGKVKDYADKQITHITKLNEIGIALSAEQNLQRLLERIVDEARAFSTADAGTLYILNEERQCLEFAIVQNDTMKTRMGGTAGPITWPPVPLTKDGQPNCSNVSSYTAVTGEIVNIPDVYEAEGFDFTGTKKFDAGTGYRSKSMLVVPMRNKENEIIGVLQLINAIDAQTKESVAFLRENVALIASLASQAAVAITNVRLYRELEHLLDSFIRAIAMAIDEKSPYTAGHIRRVQELTMIIAKKMTDQAEGVFKDFKLNEDELKELSTAAWLHDIGKVTTPEHVVDKATKLEKISDRAELVSMRYEAMKRDTLIEYYKKLVSEECELNEDKAAEIKKQFDERYNELEAERKFVLACNQPAEFMDDAKVAKLKSISEKNWNDGVGSRPFLSEDELYNLSIRKGTLTKEERTIIENHALVTSKILKSLPFPKKLMRVPEYAAQHHEKLDGTGYPFGKKAEELAYQSRIIAIADIFEALTASDRPYKKPMPISQALKILGFMKKDGHIDPDILDFFINEKIYREYADKEIKPSQIDC